MSPEQVRAEQLDGRSDIFSFGVVLYEMISGTSPFAAESAAAAFSAVLTREPPPLTRYAAEVPAELERIVRKSLEKDREQRFQSARDLLIDLKNLKRGIDSSTGTAESVSPEPPSRFRRYTFAALAVVILAAIGVLAYLSTGGGENSAIDSLAVLPFVNVGADPDNEYLSDGITESIINSLSQLPSLRVLARSTVFRYKGRDVDPQQVGNNLNVRAVLTGRIQRRSDTLIVSTELMDVAHGTQLWGEQYNRKLADILQVQAEISREISAKLRLRLSGADQKRLTKRFTENTEAYQLYLKGRYYFDKRTAEGVRQSSEYFQQAIRRDPNYALAYAGLANSYTPSDLVLPPRETMTNARIAAKKGLEIDDTLAEAHTAQARVLLFYDWDWAGAERELKRAIELNPNYAEAHHMYSHYLIALGRTEESLAQSKRALNIDQLHVLLNVHLGWNYIYVREYDRAIEQLQKALEMEPGFLLTHIFLGKAYGQKRMYREAIAELKKAMAVEGGIRETSAMLGHFYAVSGQGAEALRILDDLKELYSRGNVSPYDPAVVYAGLGKKDEALEWLDKAYKERSGGLLLLKVEPMFDSIRTDGRFEDLQRRLGLMDN